MLERIPTVLTAQEILDKAFAKAAKIDIHDPVKYHRIRKTETARLKSAVDSVAESIGKYPRAFPNMDNLRDYNTEVLDIMVGRPALRKALGSLKWAEETTRRIGREARDKIDRTRKRDGVDPFFQARKWAYGRISSIMEEVDPCLDLIREARDKVRILPTVSPDYATIVIAGYPNVGKTSLLRAWTASRAEVNSYAFTTKRAEVGHFEVEDEHGVATKYQVVDTPGLLDRPDEDRNDVERQALAALRHAADAVLFIIDPSETCGYSLEQQEHLLEQVTGEMHGLPLIVAEGKADLIDRETDRIRFSTTTGQGMDDLHQAVMDSLKFEDDVELEEDPLLKWKQAPDDDW